jgi:hypothetical protein
MWMEIEQPAHQILYTIYCIVQYVTWNSYISYISVMVVYSYNYSSLIIFILTPCH